MDTTTGTPMDTITKAGGAAAVRAYLDGTVTTALRRGLRELVRAKPADPFQFLADYLLAARDRAAPGHA
jgi:Dpy-30 motif